MLEILDTAGTVSCTTILSKLGGKIRYFFHELVFLMMFYVSPFLSNEQLAINYIKVVTTFYFIYYSLSLLLS